MKKFTITFTALLLLTVSYSQQLYKATSSKTHFFSEAPLENIEAVNEKSQGLINTETKQIAIIIPIIEFKFEKPLMEEHFNENYMETSKYKTASFQGKIISDIDFSTNGEYEATAEGVLTIHGVKKEQKIIVYDTGGGTLDVTLLQLDDGLFEVLSTSGDSHLGGDDFDNRLVVYCLDMFCRKYKHISKKEVITNKKTLSKTLSNLLKDLDNLSYNSNGKKSNCFEENASLLESE